MACLCDYPLAGGTFCAVSQKCTRTIHGSDMGPGSRRAWCWRVRLSGLHSNLEAPKQPHVEAEYGGF